MFFSHIKNLEVNYEYTYFSIKLAGKDQPHLHVVLAG